MNVQIWLAKDDPATDEANDYEFVGVPRLSADTFRQQNHRQIARRKGKVGRAVRASNL